MPLWYYGILLPKKEECSLSSILKLITDKLIQIMLSCGIIIIKNNVIKFVGNKSGYNGSHNWSIFMLENSMSSNLLRK